MSFLYPLGLLGLLGVPVLIAVYLIKNKYTEQTVSSTYIWTYSEKFLKKRKKLPKIAGLISLILQLLCVILISLTIAHPVFTFKNAADEFCFIIDGSGSMQALSGEKTRFEVGKEEIASVIEESINGCVYTLIYVGDTSTSIVYEREENKDVALKKLSELRAGFGTVQFKDALSVSQDYFYRNRAIRTYFVTDKNYQSHSNVEVVNVSTAAPNVALSDVVIESEGGKPKFSVNVAAYGADAEIEIELFIDGSESAAMTKEVFLSRDEIAVVDFDPDVDSYDTLEFRIDNDDALGYDNRIILYTDRSEEKRTALIVSDTPFFFEAAMLAAGGIEVTCLSPKEYERVLSGQRTDVCADGYGLYVFDTYAPSAMPNDGSVWLVNQSQSIIGSGFSVQGDVLLKESEALDITESTLSTVRKLVANLEGNDVHVYKYMKYGIYGDFSAIYSLDSQPLIFVGTNDFGNRETVFAFSLHDSNFPVCADFSPFIANLVDFSFPGVVEKANYTVGEYLEINIPAGCTDIKIETPLGKVDYPTDAVEAREVRLDEPGIYTVTLTVAGNERTYRVFSEYDEAESTVNETEKSFAIMGDSEDGGLDGIYDDLIIFVIVLAVLMLLDWGVYCYDKYQLR